MRIYAIHDKIAKTWAPPFFQKTDVAALRAFAAAVNTADRNNQLHTNSEDFDLYYVGTFSEDNGEFSDTADRKLLCNAVAIKAKTPTTGAQQ